MLAGLGEKPVAQSVQSELLVEPERYIGGEGQRAWWCRVSPGFAGGRAVPPWP